MLRTGSERKLGDREAEGIHPAKNCIQRVKKCDRAIMKASQGRPSRAMTAERSNQRQTKKWIDQKWRRLFAAQSEVMSEGGWKTGGLCWGWKQMHLMNTGVQQGCQESIRAPWESSSSPGKIMEEYHQRGLHKGSLYKTISQVREIRTNFSSDGTPISHLWRETGAKVMRDLIAKTLGALV